MSSAKQPVPGFSKNWCSRQSSTTGHRRYYFARGDYYAHIQDEPPTHEDHEEQLQLSEKAKRRKDGSSNKRKKKRQTKRVRYGEENATKEVTEPESRAVTFADDKRQRTDATDADLAVAEVNVQHAEGGKQVETKAAVEFAANAAQPYEDDIEMQMQRVFSQYRQHQEELVDACGVIGKDRPSYNRVSLACSTNRPVREQEVVDAIFQHINSACDGSIQSVRVVGEVSTDVRISFGHWDGHTTDAIQQLLRWSDGFYFTSMNIFRSKPRVEPSWRLFVCNIPYEASSDELLSCLSRALGRQQLNSALPPPIFSSAAPCGVALPLSNAKMRPLLLLASASMILICLDALSALSDPGTTRDRPPRARARVKVGRFILPPPHLHRQSQS